MWHLNLEAQGGVCQKDRERVFRERTACGTGTKVCVCGGRGLAGDKAESRSRALSCQGSLSVPSKKIAFDSVSLKGAKARFKQMDDPIPCFRKITAQSQWGRYNSPGSVSVLSARPQLSSLLSTELWVTGNQTYILRRHVITKLSGDQGHTGACPRTLQEWWVENGN